MSMSRLFSSKTARISILFLFDEDGQIEWSEGLHDVDKNWLIRIIKLFLASASLTQAFIRDAPFSDWKIGISEADSSSSDHESLRRTSTVLRCDEGKHTVIATPCSEDTSTQQQKQWFGTVVPTIANASIDSMQGILPALHMAAAQLTFDTFDNTRKLRLLWRAMCEHARRLYKHSSSPKTAAATAAYIARCTLALSIRLSQAVPITNAVSLLRTDIDQTLLRHKVTEFRTAVRLTWKASNIVFCVVTPDLYVALQHPPTTMCKSLHPAHALAWWYASFVSVIPSSDYAGIYSLAELAAPATVRMAFRYHNWALSAVVCSSLSQPTSDSKSLEQSAKALIALFANR